MNRWNLYGNRYLDTPMMSKMAIGLIVGLAVTGCSLDRFVQVDDATIGGQIDRSQIETYAGAVGLYNASIGAFSRLVDQTSVYGGLFTDELIITNGSGALKDTDLRYTKSPNGLVNDLVYMTTQTTRVRAAQARQLLRKYGSGKDSVSIGHTYAIEGFAILRLAEFHCSGVPLTEVPYNGSIAYTRGLTTIEMMEKAIAKFDSAQMLAADSVPIVTLARLGKGRALLGLGRYSDAAAAVRDVPTDAQYTLSYLPTITAPWYSSGTALDGYRVLNHEGGNGLDWAGATPTAEDPRVPITRMLENPGMYAVPMRQAKYTSGSGPSSVTLVRGVEARLIEAEALLQPAAAPSGNWLEKINEARRSRSDLPDFVDDPGSADARIDLLFRERAMWNYLTGSRLGDMRRLVRNYNRQSTEVFPSGSYTGPGTDGLYGNEVVYNVPPREKEQNPLYKGCLNLEA